jgi:hypothetical protein
MTTFDKIGWTLVALLTTACVVAYILFETGVI